MYLLDIFEKHVTTDDRFIEWTKIKLWKQQIDITIKRLKIYTLIFDSTRKQTKFVG